MQTEINDFEGITPVPSAHDKNHLYYPSMKQGRWVCDSPTGPCEHYQYYKTPCRHILEKRFNNLQELYTHICETVKDNRDIRDMACQSFDEVVTYVSVFREFEVNRLATLMMNIAVMRGRVTTDDLHTATNEAYANDKIVGVIAGTLIRDDLIEEIGRKPTERKCAHGRKIGVYQLTEKGFKVLESRRPEKTLEVR